MIFLGITINRIQLVYLFSSASFLASVTFIPIFSEELLLDKQFITILVGSYSFFMFLGSSLSGRASDIYGRNIVVKIGLILSAVTFSGIFFATDGLSLFIIRIISGFTAGIAPPALIALAYEQKNKMGRFSSFGSLGWGVGTILGGWIALLFSTGSVFMLSGLFFFLAFLIVLRFPELSQSDINASKMTDKTPIRSSSVRIFVHNSPIYISLGLRHSAASAVWTLWPLFLLNLLGFDTVQIGFVQGANAFTQFIIMGFLTDKLKSDNAFEFGLFLSGVTFITFLLTQIFFLFLFTQILLGFSWAMAYVGAVKNITENNTTENRGTASGFLAGTLSISGLFGPIYTLIFLNFFPGSEIYYVLILFASLMAFVAFFTHVIYRYSAKRYIIAIEPIS